MHEVSLMQSALDVAIEHAQRQEATRIHTLTMRIGEIAGVVPEALEFAFDALTQGGMAQGARLVVEWVAVECFCDTCERTFHPEGIFYECPRCRQLSANIRHGRELEVISVEVS
jgi:hydrogenase nickel incorporation protein HypA/HybF